MEGGENVGGESRRSPGRLEAFYDEVRTSISGIFQEIFTLQSEQAIGVLAVMRWSNWKMS
jgi:hypothetical protein